MTQSTNPDQSPLTGHGAVNIEIYDPVTGHIDAVQTAEAAKQVFQDSNIVRNNGVVDHAMTLAKRIAAKAAYVKTRSV
ncbi:MAG TPA: hypothetical protein VN982_01625 [Candidatus Dormibacteraeota bacterium]|nr:hypothetical protein [Candidatus Dormibacteraeota bacterium]